MGDLIAAMDAGVSVNSEDRPANDGELGILKTSCVSNWKFDPSEHKVVSDPCEIERLKECVTAGSTIISRMNTPSLVGASGYAPKGHENLFLPDRLWAIKPMAERADGLWLSMFLAAPSTRRLIADVASGTSGSMKNISKDAIRAISLPIPPLPEQRRIAEILSTWDRAIETVEALIVNARAQKAALMQQLLTGKRRLPGFSGEWREFPLGTFVALQNRRVNPCELCKADIGIELEHIEAETGRLIGTCPANEQMSLKTPFSPGDILYGKLRPYLRKFLRPSFFGVCSTEIWVLRADSTLCLSDYLLLIVQTSPFMGAADLSSGSKMPRADWKVVSDTNFQLPSISEQLAISTRIEAVSTCTSNLEIHLAYLRKEKAALMQQILTGKRRVKLANADIT